MPNAQCYSKHAIFNRYTFGQPVPGKGLLEVCRDNCAYYKSTSPLCLVKTTEVCNFGYCCILKPHFGFHLVLFLTVFVCHL